MKVIEAPNKYERKPGDVCIFLAGGITNCPNWQQAVIDGIHDFYDDDFGSEEYNETIIFNPRRENFPINIEGESERQIKWEFDALEKCDIFSMYFCDANSDQPICMYELGRNICRMQERFPLDWNKRIIITSERGYKRFKDVVIQTSLATEDILDESCIKGSIGDHIDKIIDAICHAVNNPEWDLYDEI